MSELSFAANWAQILSLVLPIGAGIWGWFRLMERKTAKGETADALINLRLENLEKMLERQFGGNSGGIREAINNMTAKVDKIEDRVNTIAVDVASLGGRFDQHIEEQ